MEGLSPRFFSRHCMSSVHKSRTRNECEYLFCCKQIKVDFFEDM